MQKSKKNGFLPRKKTPVQEHTSCAVCSDYILSRQTYTYTTSGCKCNPLIHDRCFEGWNRIHPGTCSMCKQKGTSIVNPTYTKQVPAVGASEDSCCISCILGCWGCVHLFDVFTN